MVIGAADLSKNLHPVPANIVVVGKEADLTRHGNKEWTERIPVESLRIEARRTAASILCNSVSR